MEFMHSKLEREDLLADVFSKIIESKSKKQQEMEIYVDPNHKISEDCKFGHELSKDSIKWNKYFNN